MTHVIRSSPSRQETYTFPRREFRGRLTVIKILINFLHLDSDMKRKNLEVGFNLRVQTPGTACPSVARVTESTYGSGGSIFQVLHVINPCWCDRRVTVTRFPQRIRAAGYRGLWKRDTGDLGVTLSRKRVYFVKN